jgi:hypothetical protein
MLLISQVKLKNNRKQRNPHYLLTDRTPKYIEADRNSPGFRVVLPVLVSSPEEGMAHHSCTWKKGGNFLFLLVQFAMQISVGNLPLGLLASSLVK